MRDPKKNPKVGDVIDRHTCNWSKRREVTSVSDSGYQIGYSEITPRTKSTGKVCWLTTWQRWAADAEVVRVAQ